MFFILKSVNALCDVLEVILISYSWYFQASSVQDDQRSQHLSPRLMVTSVLLDTTVQMVLMRPSLARRAHSRIRQVCSQWTIVCCVPQGSTVTAGERPMSLMFVTQGSTVGEEPTTAPLMMEQLVRT